MPAYLYYDPETGDALYTIVPMDGLALPQGAAIEVDIDLLPSDLSGVRVQNGAWFVASIEPARSAATARVNRIAGELRSRFITVIPGQEMIYLQKEIEARHYLMLDDAGTAPDEFDPDLFPFLSQEVGITAETPFQVATIVHFMAHSWRQIGARIDRVRLMSVHMIEAAGTEAEIATAETWFRSQISQLFPG
jgi:hypothetical protein